MMAFYEEIRALNVIKFFVRYKKNKKDRKIGF